MVSKPVKPRDADSTRDAILAAARQGFTQKGFDGIGVRDIARAAGCNAALINRYFGSKEALFAEVLHDALRLDDLFLGPRAQFGVNMATYLATKTKQPDHFDPLLTLLRSGGNDAARRLIRQALETQFTQKLTLWLGGDDAAVRAALIVSAIAGFDLMRSVIGSEGLDSLHNERIISHIGRTLQAYVDD